MIGTLLVQSWQTCDDWYSNGQKQSRDSQNSKNDHWCTNRHMSTKTVPIVYQSSKTVKTVKTAKMTILVFGVPIVTGLPRLYQQCTNRQKQSKNSQSSKNDHWCTNPYVYTESAEYTKSASAIRVRVLRIHKADSTISLPFFGIFCRLSCFTYICLQYILTVQTVG